MRYVFFDIECSDGIKGICEFGFVICDERFKVLQKSNYLINPKRKFNLTNRKGQEDLILSYPYEEYYSKNPFDYFYDNIRFLLTQNDVKIFGYAVSNDINFLFRDCETYSLELFNFKAFDIQKLLPQIKKKDKKFTSLDDAYNSYYESSKYKIINHRAEDDSYKTYLVFKALMEESKLDYESLIKEYQFCLIDAVSYYKETKALLKEKVLKRKALFKWNEYCEKSKDKEGIRCNLHSHLKNDIDSIKSIIEFLRKNNLLGTNTLKESDILIVRDELDRDKIKDKIEFDGKILTLQEIKNQYED